MYHNCHWTVREFASLPEMTKETLSSAVDYLSLNAKSESCLKLAHEFDINIVIKKCATYFKSGKT